MIVIQMVINLVAFMDVTYGLLHKIYYEGWKYCSRKEWFFI